MLCIMQNKHKEYDHVPLFHKQEPLGSEIKPLRQSWHKQAALTPGLVSCVLCIGAKGHKPNKVMAPFMKIWGGLLQPMHVGLVLEP